MQYILFIYIHRIYIHIYIEYTIRLLYINSSLYINLFYILYFSIFFFLLFTTFVSLFALFLSWLSSLVLFCLVSVVFNLLVSLMVSFAHRVTLLYFVFFGLFWFCVCVFLCFCYYLSDFEFTICLGFFFVCVCFNPLYCHNKQLVGSWFLDERLGLSLWVGSTESRTLDGQRTPDPREY